MRSGRRARDNSRFHSLWPGACRLLMLGLATAIIACSQTSAQEADETLAQSPAVTFGFESDISNGYFWHGLEFSYGNVFQSSAWMSAGAITFSLWTNYEPGASTPSPDLNEVDATLSLATSAGIIGLEPAVNLYLYPDQPDVPTTVELSLRTSLSLGALEPFTTHAVDIKAYPGAYFGEVGLSGAWSLSDRLIFESKAEVGWGSRRFNEAYAEIAEPAIQLVQWDIGLCWTPAGALYVRPHLGVSAVTDKVIRENLDQPSLVQGGVAI